jgi:hypothetical protein
VRPQQHLQRSHSPERREEMNNQQEVWGGNRGSTPQPPEGAAALPSWPRGVSPCVSVVANCCSLAITGRRGVEAGTARHATS